MQFHRHRRVLLFILILVMLLPATQVVTAQDTSGGLLLVSFNVSYDGRSYDSAADQTTFTYIVSGTGNPPDLSHFDLGIPTCAPALVVVSYQPSDAVSFGVDPTTGVSGIKWDLPLKTDETRTYTVTFDGNVAEGSVQVAVKGDTHEVGTITGPSCTVGAIDVNKSVSSDGVNWDDADDAPGLQVEEGGQVWFQFVIDNIGNVPLTNLTLADSIEDTSGCPALPATLAPDDPAYECVIGPLPAVEGQHTNTATASGEFDGGMTTDWDDANYFSGDLPLIEVAKSVSTDGQTWVDSTQVLVGADIFFKFVIDNTGTVPLTNLTLVDSMFPAEASACGLPATLSPDDEPFECVIGPFAALEGQHTNTAVVTAAFEGQTVDDTDTASYQSVDDEEELDVIIVIEGPVEEINVNIITIFGMEIELNPGDPILTVIRIGDTIRVEGEMVDSGTTIVVVAVNITIINVDIITSGPAGPIVLPVGCKLTGFGNGRIRCKGSGRGSGRGS